MQLVHILWTDAITSAEAGWITKEEALTIASSSLPQMETVGFVLYENNEWISVTDSMGGDEFGQINKIPMSMVIKMTYLTKEDRRYEDRINNIADIM